MLRTVLAASFVLLVPLEGLTFAPAEGDRLRTTYEFEGEYSMESMVLLVDGEEMSGHGSMPRTNQTLSEERVFLDTYEKVEGARVTRLVRTFETIDSTREDEIEMPSGTESKSTAAESELEGLQVSFDWDADEGDYVASFSEDGGDEELLEGLEASIDAALFLPEGPVQEGDSWELPASAFALFLAPGGHLKVETAQRSWSDAAVASVRGLEGDVTCTAGAEVELNGERLMEIMLVVDVETSVELEGDVSEGEARNETSYELSGLLLWNLEQGRLNSVELAGDVRMLGVTVKTVEMGESSFETERRYEIAGEASISLEVESE